MMVKCPGDCGPNGTKKCGCETGFFRHPNGECVTRDKCEKNIYLKCTFHSKGHCDLLFLPIFPSGPCGKNEVYENCIIVSKCNDPDCTDRFEKYACKFPCDPTKTGCRCIKGYFRNFKGKCVRPGKCKNNIDFSECFFYA